MSIARPSSMVLVQIDRDTKGCTYVVRNHVKLSLRVNDDTYTNTTKYKESGLLSSSSSRSKCDRPTLDPLRDRRGFEVRRLN